MFVPEMALDLADEAARLKGIMDEHGNVNIFLSEGAGVESIVAQMEAAGQEVPRDAFGHVRLDEINPGQWFAEQFAPMIGADKVLIQKSGYYSRAAAANDRDLALIKSCVDTAVETALSGGTGLVGHDEERGDELRAIEFDRIKGGKAFDIDVPVVRRAAGRHRPDQARHGPRRALSRIAAGVGQRGPPQRRA